MKKLNTKWKNFRNNEIYVAVALYGVGIAAAVGITAYDIRNGIKAR